MREYAFEQALCARLESPEAVVARQVGGGVRRPGGRVLDTVVVEPGPAFDRRAAITDAAIPAAAVESDVGVGRYRRVAPAFDCSPERAREIAAGAVRAGFFERERDGRTLGEDERLRPGARVRQVVRYPDWFARLTAVENKPDLDRPGDLRRQLRLDAALGVVDRVVLATSDHVTGAHLNRLPDRVGVWRYDYSEGAAERGEETPGECVSERRAETPSEGDIAPDAGPETAATAGSDPDRDGGLAPDAVEVVRVPEPLSVDEPGVELLHRRSGETEIAVVDAAEKRRARRRIAERAYGKGFRLAAEAFPGCVRAAEGEIAGGGGLPYCEWKGRVVDPGRECGPACAGFEEGEPPSVDPEAERDRRTAWRRDPEGRKRRQSGLDRF